MMKKLYAMGLWDMQTIIHCSLFIFLVGGLATITYYGYNDQGLSGGNNKVTLTTTTTTTAADIDAQVFDHETSLKIGPQWGTCDLFSGIWIYDNSSRYPLFDGKAVVERLRGKRMLFVGDSLNRNQWMSMMCMLHSLIPGVKQFGLELDGILHTFRATDHNISIDFYWAPMLVESNGDSPTDHHRGDRMFRINAIENHARHWVNADILIFNSYHWAREWGGKDLATCYGETEPVMNNTLIGYGIDQKMLTILESTLRKLEAKGLNVQIINITQLTQYRKDGHTSIYKKKWRPLTELETKRPENAADCSHWCLPGVPDIWNELLLAYMLQ
ncbi:trichome birefringence-like protein 34 isoform X2 [Tanacetum coccineum]|uniref:Trichome birefringence-like protein 34 isoform X2 n=1 Tax=Tanacetum coccineum TaxID=301880 RepID=A0ABQ4Z6P0_9ASTR